MYKGKKVSAIIQAAGSGLRMNSDKTKLLIEINKKPVILRTLEKISSCKYIDDIVLVIKKEDKEEIEKIIKNINKKIIISLGGKTREESTFNGLKSVPMDSEIVMSHDGARPFVSKELLEKSIEEIEGFDGTVTCVPRTDTIKILREDMSILETPDRKYLYNVQTPQVFYKDKMMKAYKWARNENISSTDDSNILERYGANLKAVIGEYNNIKITTPKDLAIGEYILRGEK